MVASGPGCGGEHFDPNFKTMQQFNIIHGLESQEYSWKKTVPNTMPGTATGEAESLEFSGSLESMKSMAESFLTEGNATLQVSCSVSRQEAGMAKLQVSRVWYNVTGGDAGDVGSDGESGSGSTAAPPGSSEASPLIDISFNEVQVPILCHPKVTSLGLEDSSAQMVALRMRARGADDNQVFVAQGNVTQTVGEALKNVSPDIVELVGKQEYFLDITVTYSVRWEVDSNSRPSFGAFPRIEAPKDAPKLSGKRNWLFCGGGISVQGDKIFATKVYKSSDVNGWSKDSYSS